MNPVAHLGRLLGVTALGAALALSGCSSPQTGSTATTSSPPDSQPSRGSELTILYTSDEHGWIEPLVSEGVRRGGVSQLLAHLQSVENHCAGALPPAPQPDCSASSTLLMSGGDSFTGPAISSFFRGETMAKSMRRLGYAASAFGNHELDFGREQFFINRRLGGYPHVSANLLRKDGKEHELADPYMLIKRGEVTLGVVGISTVSTPETASAKPFAESTFQDPATALARTIPKVWQAGADAVVLLAHECHDIIAPMIAEHPEWDLSFVGTGHCHRTSVEIIGGVPVIGPDWRLHHYARVRLRIDRARQPRRRAQVVGYELVEVAGNAAEPLPTVDAHFDATIASWAKDVDSALGEVIGYSSVGLAKKSRALGRWIVRAWLDRFDVDLAITTHGAVRQELPPGAITMATVASIMPFDNELVVCQVPGVKLLEMLKDPKAIVAGFERKADGSYTHADGTPVDPRRAYRVVTTDFLFDGGDGYTFRQHDPAPTMTGLNWRVPVVEWTKKANTSEQRPLESLFLKPVE